ncbi:hypothetical protein BDW02DRAFT_575889 [Decorospora gaudefroyi]|uniref:Uncharacterized protein n=1 Tax=Decorospora gaudefroyi TaxID=184978 RepID=A0A6A5KW35_9PLEO|nr:hypothetical protein BDW02DRAFT_575889 [Decorospora gaudefroyi]
MGGMAIIWDHERVPRPHLLTARSLVKQCDNVNNLVDDTFRLSHQEILDKSKADSLVKTIVTLQISWLLISVFARIIRGLPTSQLEICTIAFAVLAIPTFAANGAKPKDVDCPILIPYKDRPDGLLPDDLIVDPNEHSFTTRSLTPFVEISWNRYRIADDSFRLQANGTLFTTLSYALAFSTAGFGAIHCAAWRSEFPTRPETLLWRVASVLSTTLPLSNLILMGVTSNFLHRESRKMFPVVQRCSKKWNTCPDALSTSYTLFWKDNEVWCSQTKPVDSKCTFKSIALTNTWLQTETLPPRSLISGIAGPGFRIAIIS